MPAGLEVANNNGVIQIDGSYANLSLRHKIYVNTWNSTYYEYAGDAPALVSLPDDGYGWTIAANRPVRDGVWAFDLVGGQIGTSSPGASGWIYVFDRPSVWTNVGLQVFNEAGNLVYSSGQGQLKLTWEVGMGETWHPSMGTMYDGAYSTTGKTLAVMENRPGYEIYADDSLEDGLWYIQVAKHGCLKCNGLLFWSSYIVYDSGGYTYANWSGAPRANESSRRYVDVTGL